MGSKISGAGVISGGEYDSIKIAGSGKKAGSFECESIEGDEITLEKVTCAVVSGKNIRIGDGCVIEKLISSGDVDISPDAVVKSVEKSE